MKNLKIVLAVFFVLLIAGCLESNNKKADAMSEKPPGLVEDSKTTDSKNTDFEYDNYIFQDPYKNEKTGMAWKVFQETLTVGENHVYSPMSLELVLTLLMQASKGESRKALETFLQLEGSEPLQHMKTTKGVFDYMNDPANYYGGDGTGPEVKIGFGVAANASNPLDVKAIAPLKAQLDLFMMNLDFRNKNQEALDAINGWVAGQTNDKIKNLLEHVSRETVMMLINTLYLKASWTDPFKEENTKPMKFTGADGSSKQVPTMNRSGFMTYLDNDHFQALSLNIELRDMEFWFLRPKKDIGAVVNILAKTPLKNALAEPHSQKINLSMPKFKIKNKIKLMDVLKKMGLEILTKSPNTELDGFFTGKGDFIVSEAIQGNFFAIDEKGVEAASATALGMRAGGVPKPEEPIDLKFDKPFVFLMYSRTTGRLAFVGAVSDPMTN